jgi:hypothetical protein
MNRTQSIKKKQSDIFIFILFMFLTMLCAVILGFVAYQGGLFDNVLFSASMTRTAVAENNASCQLLIQKAMEASDEYCSSIDSNKACYGNNTLKADLVAGSADQFTERGDVVDVEKLQRIVASPLKPESNEWGIAVLKVLANLPRSLPGQTITMVVFGNTTLDNESGNLESFFFSSELGQIQCEKVPDDGIMISVPEGEGVSFMVNGAELTLTGDASITAQKNGKMEVNLYEGAGRIVSDGQEQYFGAGQQVSVQLGGENGNQSIGAPSEPTSISQDDLDTACSLTGQYCQQDQIIPVSGSQAQEELQQALGITPTVTPAISLTATRQPSLTFTYTPTLLILPTRTSTRLPIVVITRTPTKIPTRTITPGGPTRTRTLTRTPTITRTITNTRTPTITPGGPTFTPTDTPTLTSTVTDTPTITFTSTITETPTSTSTNTQTPTSTPTNTSSPTCGNVSAGGLTNPTANQLQMTITNSSGSTIRMDSLHVVWVDSPSSQRITSIILDGVPVWSGNENNPNTDIPSEQSWSGSPSDRDIDPGTVALLLQFDDPLTTGNTVEPTFDIGCSISSSN